MITKSPGLSTATLTGGVEYFFDTGLDQNGNSFMTAVPAGLSDFRILGIETADMVDPASPTAFLTGLQFLNFTAGTTFSMTGIPETIYVDNPGDFVITANQGAAGLDNGDTVTWIGNPSIGTDDVTGLVFGATAFGTITSALVATEIADTTALTTIKVGYGTFVEHLTILTDSTIVGSGSANTILDGSSTGTVVTVNSGATASLSDLKITHGLASDGGGINNSGTLSVTNSTLSNNRADNNGGGILNGGTLTVMSSTLSNNSSGYFGGGGILNNGILTVTNSTLSNNSASYYGGGIVNFATLTMTNSTLSNNSGNATGGGLFNAGGSTATLNNNIVANSNSGDDIVNEGTLSGSNNLIEVGSGLSGLSGTLTSDPLLGPLQDNGGPTFTHGLFPGSPAINAGNNSLALDVNGNPLTTDQRGTGFGGVHPAAQA